MVPLGFTWSRSHLLDLTWHDLLKPQHLPANWRAGGTNGTGGCKARFHVSNHQHQSQKLTRAQRESPEPIQEAPEMLQELTEPFFIAYYALHTDLSLGVTWSHSARPFTTPASASKLVRGWDQRDRGMQGTIPRIKPSTSSTTSHQGSA